MKLVKLVFFIALFAGGCHLGSTCNYYRFRECLTVIPDRSPDDCGELVPRITQCFVNTSCSFDAPELKEEVRYRFQRCYEQYSGSDFTSGSVPLMVAVFLLTKFVMA